jgi:hypothetical protein
MREIHFSTFSAVNTHGLEVRKGGVDRHGVGLFAARPLRAGDAIGFYAGIPCCELTREQEAFAVDVGGFDAAILPPLDAHDRVDFELYPMAAANEPAEGCEANMVLVGDKIYEVGGNACVVLAFYAAAAVEAGDELLWQYGPKYRRDYPVGHYPEFTPECTMTVPRLERLMRERPDAIFPISELESAELQAPPAAVGRLGGCNADSDTDEESD